MKVTKCGTCGHEVREGDEFTKVARMHFHASYEGCSDAMRRSDIDSRTSLLVRNGLSPVKRRRWMYVDMQ